MTMGELSQANSVILLQNKELQVLDVKARKLMSIHVQLNLMDMKPAYMMTLQLSKLNSIKMKSISRTTVLTISVL